MVNPLANYYTKFYFGVGATLWATTFSFAVLFIPKVYIFYKQWLLSYRKKSNQKQRKNSESSDNTKLETNTNDGDVTVHSFLKSNDGYNKDLNKSVNNYDLFEAGTPYTKSLLLEQTASDNIITRTYSSGAIGVSSTSIQNSVSPIESNHRYDNTNVYVEVQEVCCSILIC